MFHLHRHIISVELILIINKGQTTYQGESEGNKFSLGGNCCCHGR